MAAPAPEKSTDEFLPGVMPKRPIQAEDFIRNNETFDGRGIVVAILDTGVDPGAAGLSKTTDGRHKITHVRDCSGSGDVDTSVTVEATAGPEEGTVVVKGLTGKDLVISTSTCSNPSGVWHVGAKCIYDFFPRGLVRRLKDHYGEGFQLRHAKLTANATSELAAFDREHGGEKLDRKTLVDRKELVARLELLKAAGGSEDVGPYVDCVVFQDDQQVWRALVDTDGSGDLRGKEALASYGEERVHAKWDHISQLNYCVNIFNNGNLLSLVVDSGAHGTHVASIVAGYYPEQPDLNGVAPGAQIVSLKIGDGRLDGMETGQALIRAVSVAAELEVDVINMSFGEPSQYPSDGVVVEKMRELVEKHGIIFVTSAGNAGPALSTVGAPACAGDFMIGVAAYVETDMMISEYNIHSSVTPSPLNYTWSSRGPCYNGFLGVSISAPGGAIAAVPQWTLQQKMMMNGTSMASPNACGGIALILSGLKQNGISYSPSSIKRAIEGTAEPIPGMDAFSQGAGLIKVADAYASLVKLQNVWYLELPFDVQTSNGGHGIYLREPWEVEEETKHSCRIVPKFERDEGDPGVGKNVNRWSKSRRNALEVQLKLESSAGWLKFPEFVFQNSAVSFQVNVNPAALPNKTDAHFAWIKAFDTSLEGRGVNLPLWKVPVTVIVPTQIPRAPAKFGSLMQLPPTETGISFDKLEFKPGTVMRYFLVVPHGATWMDVKITPETQDPPSKVVGRRQFYIHCLQMNQTSNYSQDENRKRGVMLAEEQGQEGISSLDVRPGTVEVCIAGFWSSLGHGFINVEIAFRGIAPVEERLSLDSKNGMTAKVTVVSQLRSTTLRPSASLRNWSQTIAPKNFKLAVMPNGSRDEVFGRPVWSLVLDYEIKQATEGKIRPTIPNFNEMIYESPVHLCMYYVFDENKSLIHAEEARPSFFDVPKGKLLLKLCIRHEDHSVLDQLKSTCLVVERKLSKPIKLAVYPSLHKSLLKSKKEMAKKTMTRGSRTTMFITLPKDFKAPEGVSAGDILSGEITYCENTSWGAKTKPTPWPIVATVSALPDPKSGDEKEPKLKEAEEEESEAAKKNKVIMSYIMPVLKSRIEGLEKLAEADSESYEKEAHETEGLLEKYSDLNLEEVRQLRMRCLQSRLRWNQKEYATKNSNESRAQVLETCGQIVTEEVVGDLGKLHAAKPKDLDDVEASDKQKKEEERLAELRKIVVYTLVMKILISDWESKEDEHLVQSFAEDGDLPFEQLRMERYKKSQKVGLMLTQLEKLLKADAAALKKLPIPLTQKELYQLKVDSYEQLGWDHLMEFETKRMRKLFPTAYALI